jgi:hypothetical protein
MKFIVGGQIEVGIEIVIDADSEVDAREQFESLDLFVDEKISCTELNISSTNIDTCVNKAAQTWEDTDRLERAQVLVQNGVEREAAFDSASLDASDLPREWLEYFDYD